VQNAKIMLNKTEIVLEMSILPVIQSETKMEKSTAGIATKGFPVVKVAESQWLI